MRGVGCAGGRGGKRGKKREGRWERERKMMLKIRRYEVREESK